MLSIALSTLAEIHAPDFPGERLMVCFNPLLAAERRRKREDLLQATEKGLTKLAAQVARRTKTPMKQSEIGLKAGKFLAQYKVGKHFILEIRDGGFAWSRREEGISRESELDGLYVIRTSEPAEQLSTEDTVRSYKSLSQVERMFRCLKGLDLLVRPIRHRTRGPCSCSYLSLHAGLLCGMAYAKSVGSDSFRR